MIADFWEHYPQNTRYKNKKIIGGNEVPTHSHALVNGQILDVNLLWDKMFRLFKDKIITRSEMSALD